MLRTSPVSRIDDGKPKDSHLLLVGGGPRGIIQASSEIVFMLLYRSHFEALIAKGAKYQIKTTVVEKQSFLGVGGSFNAGQTGMMNSGIEDDIEFPLPLPEESEQAEFFKSLLSYRDRYDQYLSGKEDEYFTETKKLNLPGAVMFKKSLSPSSTSPAGQLDHEYAYLMRRTVGEEEVYTFGNIQNLAEKMLPFYKLQIRDSTAVRNIQFNSAGRQMTTVQSLNAERPEHILADQVRMNTGTTAGNPISDPMVRELTFCRPMNALDFRRYCEEGNLLDASGYLRPGVKVLSGGMGLSGLDQISVLDNVMGLFEEDESSMLGYRVTDEAKRNYQGAITIVNRTTGRTCLPRHTGGFEWEQGTPVIGTSEQLHALFLHEYGQELYQIWTDILAANVARATNRTPDTAMCGGDSTARVLKAQFEETKWFLECRSKAAREEMRGNVAGKEFFLSESSRTLYGAWRQAALSVIFGFGLTDNGEKSQKDMQSYAPLTWKGREIWLFHRTQVSTMCDPRYALKKGNLKPFENWSEIMRHVTSSPVEVQSMFHLLFEAGIARYVQASYEDISSTGNSLTLQGHNYDALIVSPVFSRNENEAVRSLSGQTTPYHADKPSYGQVGKFRRFIDGNGKTVPIEDSGLGGRGFDVIAEDGVKSRVGSFAIDINNRASGTSVASSFTLRRMAVAHLNAAGVKNSEKVMNDIYERSKPSEEAYSAEVRKFKAHFEDAFQTWAYLEAIKQVAGNDSELFRVLFDAGLTRSARKEQMRNMSNSGVLAERQAYALYRAHVKSTPEYKPTSRDTYYDRFVDTTADEDMFMYNEAHKMAQIRLEQNRKTAL